MSFLKAADSNKSPFNNLTLTFKDKEINKSYNNDSVCKALVLARLSLMLGIVIFVLFSFIDKLILDPEAQAQVMQLRIIAISLFLATIALTFNRRIWKFYQMTMLSILLISGAILILMIMAADSSGGNYYYAGLILAIIYAHSLLRLRFIVASSATWFIVIVYEVVALKVLHIPEGIFFNNSLFIVSANFLGMFASYGIEYYMKISFWRNLMLQEKSRLLEKEHKRKTDELEDARQIQLSMIPNYIPEHPLYDISYVMKTASEVGGDYFDMIISDDGTITFAVGDATGHGAKAGVMVTAMKFLFSNYAEKMELTDFLRRADHSLRQMRLPRLYMSFVIGRIKGDLIEVSGVGMPAITMFNSSVSKICKLNLKGFPLGSQNLFEYKKHSSVISDNDTIMVMTDGMPELFNAKNETFGYDKVEREFLKSTSKSADEIVKHLTGSADEWKGNHPQQDDITLLIIKKKQKVNVKVPVNNTFVDNIRRTHSREKLINYSGE
jgi:hypothetical protein